MLHQIFFAAQIALAWFFALSVGAGLMFLAARPVARGVLRGHHPAEAPLAIRLLPAAVSVGTVLALVLPAFAWLEPFGSAASGERLGVAGSLLATGGALLLLVSFGRGVAAVAVTRWRMRALMDRGSRSTGGIAGTPLFVSDSPMPCLLLDGLVRPRLFVSRSVLDRLSPAELDRAVAHELAHHRAHDNIKRRLLAFAPDLVSWSPLARDLERAWKRSAEMEADADATREGEAQAVTLASALLKVARLCGGHPQLDLGRAAFHDGAPVAERIRRLCTHQPDRAAQAKNVRLFLRVAALAAFAALAINAVPVLTGIHRVTELIVHLP